MEAQQIQLYQMKEKQARKMADIEFDKMWHEVTMKEADALVNVTHMRNSYKLIGRPTIYDTSEKKENK